MYLLSAYAFGDGYHSVSSKGICLGTAPLAQQARRHLTRGIDHSRDAEIARRLYQVVSAQHVVAEDLDLCLTARGRVGRQMADAVRPELEKRVVNRFFDL
jgi:hypothetical protein